MKKIHLTFRRVLTYAAGLILIAGLFAACKKDNAATTRIPSAGLMVFNLAPDREPIGVALSGNPLTNRLWYTSFNGNYQNIYTGQRSILAYDWKDSVLVQSDFTFNDSSYYSLFVVGNNGVYKSVTVKDELDSSATADKAYIRYINAIPDSSAPVVTITSAGTQATNTPARFSTVSRFVPVTEGDVKVQVNNGNKIAADRTFPVIKGRIYTALLIGVPGATDSTRSVQIRYIENGFVAGNSGSGK